MPATTQTQFADLYTPIFDKMYMQAYNETAGIGERFFEVIPDTSKDYKTSGISTLSGYDLVAEAQEIPLDRPQEGFDVTLTPKKFGKHVQLSYEFVEDIEARYTDINSQIEAVVNAKRGEILDMARRARYKMDSMCAEIFNLAGTSSTYTWGASTVGGDGVVLVSDSHPYSVQNASVLDNKGTTALSEAAIETMMIQIASNAKDPRGEIIDVAPSILLVPPALGPTALRLMKSMLRPGTANNDPNIHQGEFEVVVWRRLTDANNWFLVEPKLGLKIIQRKEPSFRFVDNPVNETYNFVSTFRAVPGFDDWRGVWGSIV